MNKHTNKGQFLATDEEYQSFAEQFIDAVLDPRQPWLMQYISVFGFPPVPTEQQIASGALAAKMRDALNRDSCLMSEWFYDALEKRDRQKLVDVFKQTAHERQLTRDELSRLLACVDFKTLKKSIRGLSEPFKFRPGPTPPTERQYDEALKCAENLRPVLLQLLNQQSLGTANTIGEILNYLTKDFPTACRFLLGNLPMLEAFLRDPRLLKKARTRAPRARILADAIAGSIHLGRQPSTAVEYLGIERRRRRKSFR